MGAEIINAGTLTLTGGSITEATLNGGTNGIRIADDDHTLGPDTVTVSGSTITATAAGANEAAIRVDGPPSEWF